MNRYVAQIESAVRALTFPSPRSYAWFGRRSPPLPPPIRRALTPPAARQYVRAGAQFQLYHDFYCQGLATPSVPRPWRPGGPRNTLFVEQLIAANGGQGCWEPGWQQQAVEAEQVVLRRGELTVWAGSAQYQPAAAPLAANAGGSLRFPKHLLGISPDFYTALSDTPLQPADYAALVRFYWNVDSRGALRLMTGATRLLNGEGLPFKLKVVNDPERFRRCDAAVLYVRQADYAAVWAVLSRLYADVSAHLGVGVPALTKPLAPGVGFAEDPGDGDSFGLQRCLLIAEALICAQETRCTRFPARLQQVLNHFATAGISLEQPFVRPGAVDTYPVLRTATPFARAQPAHAPPDTTAYLLTAQAIGQHLAREAIWHADHCNWIGASQSSPAQGGSSAVIYQALAPDLYGGTCGVALFLAELAAITQDATLRRPALGAVRQALAQAERVPPAARLSLYSGWVGIALAATRIGLLLGVESLLAGARQLLGTLPQPDPAPLHDFLAGSAGAVAGLLILGTLLEDAALGTTAIALGTGLIAAADKSAIGYSWPAPHPTRRNLTGLAHGAAGIGFALLELYAATRDTQFRTAAERAYAYERHWFDAERGNWPDFRTPLPGRPRHGEEVFVTYWCHGGPGIALTRLRAYALLGNRIYQEEAAAALKTTQQAILKTLPAGSSDYSLCHGLAGLTDILRYGAASSGLDAAAAQQTVHATAAMGLQRYGAGGHTWAGGGAGGEPPGLMLGMAGIGLFYLRLYAPRTPTPLIIQPDIWVI